MVASGVRGTFASRWFQILFRLLIVGFLSLFSSGFVSPAPVDRGTLPSAPQAPTVSPLNPVVGSAWGTDGPVLATAIHGRTLYLGGKFTQICKPLGVFRVYDTATGLAQPGWPLITGGNATVNAILSDGAGGWFVGGDFTQVGGQPRLNLAHILSDKTLDTAWAPQPDNPVYSLAKVGDILYVAGNFIHIAGQTQRFLAALNAATGARITTFNPVLDGGVMAVAANATVVYIGGTFFTIGVDPHSFLGAVTADTGAALPWADAPNFFVNDLALSGGTLFASGEFGFVGAGVVARNGLASFIASTTVLSDTGKVTSWDPQVGGAKNALVVSGDTLFVGGNIVSAMSQTRFHAVAFKISDGSLLDWLPNFGGDPIQSMAVNGNVFYAGSSKLTVNGQARGSIGAVDAGAAAALAFNPAVSGPVMALASDGTALAAGFTGNLLEDCLPRANLAAINLDTGQPLAWNPTVNDEVDALALDGDTLYAGGQFQSVGSQSRIRLAGFDLLSGNLTTWNQTFIVDDAVKAIKINGPDVLVGGAFTTIGGKSRPFLAALNKTNGAANAWNPGLNAEVDAFAINAGTIFVGGKFNLLTPGGARSCLASFSTGVITPTAWAPGLDFCFQFPAAPPGAAALEIFNNTLYLGGSFNTISPTMRLNLAAFDPAIGSLNSWNPMANTIVDTLASGAGKVLAGGQFFQVGNQPFQNLAAIDPANGASDPNWSFRFGGNFFHFAEVNTLAASGNLACAGGYFSSISEQPRNYFACMDLLAARTGSPGLSTLTSAVLTGTVTSFFNPGGHPSFEWGTQPGVYTATTPIPATPNTIDVTSTVTVSATLPNLLPGHTYYYRLVVTDNNGPAYGQEMRFTSGVSAFLPAVLLVK